MTQRPEPIHHHDDPQQVQMSIGEHLEELRRRIFLGMAGLLPAVVVCLFFGSRLLSYLTWPLIRALNKYDISPQLYADQPADVFMNYIKVSMIAACCIAGPWILYHVWQFVRAGLYPNERKYVTKYIPLSITLLIAGMIFVFFIVLPWSLQFFISFTTDVPLPPDMGSGSGAATTQPTFVQAVRGDPPHPSDFQIWFDTSQNRLKMFNAGQVRVIAFGSSNLVAPHFTLPDYLDLVLQLLLTFGLAFQLPLVVMALARIGIVDIATLKSLRRYIYFGLTILAAALSPGDVVTATVALLIPLIFLYEFGIFLAKMGMKEKKT